MHEDIREQIKRGKKEEQQILIPYIYMYIYLYIYVCIYIYMYIYFTDMTKY